MGRMQKFIILIHRNRRDRQHHRGYPTEVSKIRLETGVLGGGAPQFRPQPIRGSGGGAPRF